MFHIDQPIQRSEVEKFILNVEKLEKEFFFLRKKEIQNMIEVISGSGSIEKFINRIFDQYIQVVFLKKNNQRATIPVKEALSELVDQSNVLRKSLRSKHLDLASKNTQTILYRIGFNIQNLDEVIKDYLVISEIFQKVLDRIRIYRKENNSKKVVELSNWFFELSGELASDGVLHLGKIQNRYELMKKANNW
ncbi:MAG: hypothetical protein GNW80_01685 [Asgard group archaeon]|nr:hypothetical protein [Asgard group archaeon]